MPKAKPLTASQRAKARGVLAQRSGQPAALISDQAIAAALTNGSLSLSDCGPSSADSGGTAHSVSFTDSVSAPSVDTSGCG
jgi:hypothetical protein